MYGDILHRDILGQGYFCVGYLLGYFRSGIFLLGIFMLGTKLIPGSRVKHLYLFNQIGETSGPSSAFLAEEELTRSVDGISPEFDTTDNFKEKLGFSTLLATMSPNTRNRILAAKNGMYVSAPQFLKSDMHTRLCCCTLTFQILHFEVLTF